MSNIDNPNKFIQFSENAATLTHPTEIPGGVVAAIPSKSHAHRLLIAAALSRTPVRLLCPTTSKDIDATADCLRAMGTVVERTEEGFLVSGGCRDIASDSAASLHVGESGSTLRFLLPVLGALGRTAELHMQGRLSERPLSPLYEEMCRHGISLSPQGTNPLQIRGNMTAGTYVIDGGVSSQYITGLLFALPLLSGDSRLVITGRLESRPYVDITLQVLREFGITVRCTEPAQDPEQPEASILYEIPGGQEYRCESQNDVEEDRHGQRTDTEEDRHGQRTDKEDGHSIQRNNTEDNRHRPIIDPAEVHSEQQLDTNAALSESQSDISPVPVIRVEGDWSNTAFFLTAGALLEQPVTVTGCNLQSPQGDRAIVGLLREFGAEIEVRDTSSGSPEDVRYAADSTASHRSLTDITVRGGHLKGIEIDAADIPDLVPILSVAAAYAEGTTLIRNIERLRIKESDRVATVLELLSGLGAEAKLVPDPSDPSKEAMCITGSSELRGGTVSSHNDHRIAMAAAIASLRCKEPVILEDPMAVRKSYPGFYQDLERILITLPR